MLWIVGLVALSFNAQAQPSYYLLDDKASMHFVGVSYATGTTDWRSGTNNYELLDQHGLTVVNGTSTFRANNRQQSLSLETLVPLNQGKWRLGLGLTFEEFSLYKIDVEMQGITEQHPFVERFRFDKVFAQAEVPLPILENKYFSFNANLRGGWYGFSNVNSSSLFGEKRIGKAWFTGLGLGVDVLVAKRVYLLVMPNVEYKYFKNTRDDLLGNIYHNMFSYNILMGVRVHVL